MANPSIEAARSDGDPAPGHIYLVSYPKIMFFYPTLLAAIAAALVMSFRSGPLDPTHTMSTLMGTVFLGVFAVNLVVLAFDFPRTTSLTLFFFAAAIVMGVILLVVLKPGLLPYLTHLFDDFHPLANATFYWSVAAMFGVIFTACFISMQFDYWEVRPNELLHHHGFLANLERFPSPHLRIDKEINDLFEYLLMQSGRLILQASSERRAIILDNIPFIKKKEEAITRMLGALQVSVRDDTK